MNLSDRQADAAIQRWLELLSNLRCGEFRIGHAMKRSFSSAWLRPEEVVAPVSPIRRAWRRIRGADVGINVLEPGGILIARGSRADREMFNLEGVTSHLLDLQPQYASLVPESSNIGLRLRRGAGNGAKHWRAVVRTMQGMRLNTKAVDAVRHEFALPEHFDDWFWTRAWSAIWKFFAARDLLERVRPFVLVSAGDNMPGVYPLHAAAIEKGIPSIAIQHGFIGQEWLHFPLWADRICVWGDVERHWYNERGVEASRVAVTGNPRGITKLPKNRMDARRRLGLDPDCRLVVWFTTPHGGHWHQRFTEWVKTLQAKAAGATIVLKLHPKETPEPYAQSLPGVRVLSSDELGVNSAIAMADMVVHDHSSIGAEALFCGQHVICAAINPPYPNYYDLLIGPQYRASTPAELARHISELPPPTLEIRPSPCLRAGGEEAAAAIAREIRHLVEDPQRGERGTSA